MHSLHEPDPPNVRGGPFLPQTQPPSCMTLDMQSVTSREWRQNSSCAYICPSFSSFSSRTATVLVDIARLEIEIVELKPGRRESGNQDMKARCNCIPTGYKQTSRPESGTNHMRQITSAKSNLIRQLLNFNLELVIFCHQHTYQQLSPLPQCSELLRVGVQVLKLQVLFRLAMFGPCLLQPCSSALFACTVRLSEPQLQCRLDIFVQTFRILLNFDD